MERFSPVVKSLTAKEVVYLELRNAILKGEIDPDEYFTEVQLAEQLNTSRTPVREALKDLIKDGLLINVRRKGAKIRGITDSEINQIMFLRDSIEIKGLITLMDNVSNESINVLEKLLLEQRKAMSNQDEILFIELDQEFHIQIITLAKLDLLKEILENLYGLTRLIGHRALAKKGRMEEVITEHEELLSFIKNNNIPEATQKLKIHLQRTLDTLKGVRKYDKTED